MPSLLFTACTTPTLVALIGPPGAGKSTVADEIAKQYAGRVVVLSLDEIRADISPHRDECDQSVTPQAVARLHGELDAALAAGAMVVVDATNANAEHRLALLEIAARHQAHTIALVVLPPLEVALARNAARSSQTGPCGWARRVPDRTVVAMHTAIAAALSHLPAEGWREVHQIRHDAAQKKTLCDCYPLTEGRVMTLESELLAKEANGWNLCVPGDGDGVDYPVCWRPRYVGDHSPWVVLAGGTGFRFSHEIIVATPPPTTHNMVCRVCFHALSHSRGRWVEIDGMCENCAVADLAADVNDF